ncbi:hypothetical protein C0J52_16722 [Blattella germanica]|nr:hypothetical protein C0J52_16722 [Blattella germanica]
MCIILILSTWDDYQDNSISFVPDTNYLDWNTAFPSVVLCPPSLNQNLTYAYIREKFGDLSQSIQEKLLRTYQAIADLQTQSDLKRCQNKKKSKFKPITEDHCPKSNLSNFILSLTVSCQELFEKCVWYGKEFDCCKYFLPIRFKWDKFLNMYSNRTTGPGTLRLETKSAAEVMWFSNEEIPTFNTEKNKRIRLTEGITNYVFITVAEVDNDEGVRNVEIAKRKCKFPNENKGLTLFKEYSFSTCLLECRKNIELEICNCTSPLLPGCNDTNGLEIKLDHLSTVRYKRKVVRDKLDMVVNLGGTAGLFVGASILSLVEMLFYLLIRPIWERIASGKEPTSLHHPPEPHKGSTFENSLPVHEQLQRMKKK